MVRVVAVTLRATARACAASLSTSPTAVEYTEHMEKALSHRVKGPLTWNVVEVTRQCSNLAPSLQLAVSSHREIRRRRRPVTVTQEFKERLPVPLPRLTVEMLDEAEHRYRNGETLRQVAHALGVSRPRLSDRLRKRGVVIRRQSPSPEQVLEMARRYEQGESLARVGARVGFDAGTVRTHLRSAGVAIRDAHGRR